MKEGIKELLPAPILIQGKSIGMLLVRCMVLIADQLPVFPPNRGKKGIAGQKGIDHREVEIIGPIEGLRKNGSTAEDHPVAPVLEMRPGGSERSYGGTTIAQVQIGGGSQNQVFGIGQERLLALVTFATHQKRLARRHPLEISPIIGQGPGEAVGLPDHLIFGHGRNKADLSHG